jgi:hypothetical protein
VARRCSTATISHSLDFGIDKTTESIGNITTKPIDNISTEPIDNIAKPIDNITKPIDNITKPIDSITTKPIDHFGFLLDSTTKPIDNITEPIDNTCDFSSNISIFNTSNGSTIEETSKANMQFAEREDQCRLESMELH